MDEDVDLTPLKQAQTVKAYALMSAVGVSPGVYPVYAVCGDTLFAVEYISNGDDEVVLNLTLVSFNEEE